MEEQPRTKLISTHTSHGCTKYDYVSFYLRKTISFDHESSCYFTSFQMHHNGPKSHRTTKYYAWIFGAAMVSLLCMLSVTGCVIFCICGERWNLRRPKTKIYNNSEYERVDSISSMVDQNVNHDTVYDPIDDDMTII